MNTSLEKLLERTGGQAPYSAAPTPLPDANGFCEQLTRKYALQVEKLRRGYVGGYVDDPNTAAVLSSVSKWLDGGKPWLLLTGNVGTGKTVMLHALASLLAPRIHDRMLGSGEIIPGVLVRSALEIAKCDDDEYQNARYAKVLLIDDFGVEPGVVKSYGNAATNVTDALYHRYERRAPTVITTNLPLSDIAERYGERLADRMREVADRVAFSFKSFRTS